MKYLLPYLLCFVLSEIHSQEYIKNRESYNLIGTVKSVDEERIALGWDGAVTPGGKRIENVTLDKSKLVFDGQGRMITSNESSNSKNFGTNVTYNEKGQVTNASIYHGLGGMMKIATHYDESGNITELRQTLNEQPASFLRYTYSDGKVKEHVFKDSLHGIGTHATLRYNKKGQREFETILWSGPSPTIGTKVRTTHEFLYNTSGKLHQVIEKDYDRDGIVVSDEVMTYDENEVLAKSMSNTYGKNKNIRYATEVYYQKGQQLKRTVYDSTGNIYTRSTKALNENGFVRLYEYEERSNGVLKMIESKYSKYDAFNNLVEEKSNTHGGAGSGTTRTFTYKFDSRGNWIIKCSYSNGHRDEAHVRTIEYTDGEQSQASKEDAVAFCK